MSSEVKINTDKTSGLANFIEDLKTTTLSLTEKAVSKVYKNNIRREKQVKHHKENIDPFFRKHEGFFKKAFSTGTELVPVWRAHFSKSATEKLKFLGMSLTISEPEELFPTFSKPKPPKDPTSYAKEFQDLLLATKKYILETLPFEKGSIVPEWLRENFFEAIRERFVVKETWISPLLENRENMSLSEKRKTLFFKTTTEYSRSFTSNNLAPELVAQKVKTTFSLKGDTGLFQAMIEFPKEGVSIK